MRCRGYRRSIATVGDCDAGLPKQHASSNRARAFIRSNQRNNRDAIEPAATTISPKTGPPNTIITIPPSEPIPQAAVPGSSET